MDVYTILMILIGVIVFLFIVSIFKKVLKIALILAIVFFLLLYFTKGSLSDYTEIKDSISVSPVVVVMEDVGFITGEKYDFLSKEESLMDQKELLKENYKIFYLESNVFSQDIEINNKLIEKEELYNYFKNNKEISSITYEDLALEIISDEEDFSSALLAYYYDAKLKPSTNPITFFSHYKQGDIEVYPETMFFKMSKVLPLSWIEGKINKLKSSED